jgi:hypothetical protein
MESKASYSPGEGVEYSQEGYMRVLEPVEFQEKAGNQSRVDCRVMSWQGVCGKERLRAIVWTTPNYSEPGREESQRERQK